MALLTQLSVRLRLGTVAKYAVTLLTKVGLHQTNRERLTDNSHTSRPMKPYLNGALERDKGKDHPRTDHEGQRGIARAERDGTRAETRFHLSPKRTSPFKSVGASVQLTTGSRGVRISSSNGSNAGQTTFRGKVGLYWLPTPFACFPFTSPPVGHRVPSGSARALKQKPHYSIYPFGALSLYLFL